MPLRVAVKVAVLVLALLLTAASLAYALAQLSIWATIAFLLGVALGGLWLVFVYLPAFDPFGMTLVRVAMPGNRVALSFDDGPSAHTEAVLDLLATHQAKATFFFLGQKANARPELVARARNEGHALGNHGFSHRKLHRLNAAEIRAELEAGATAIGELATVRGRRLLRAPHGFKSLTLIKILKQQGYWLTAWSAGVWDSDCPGAEVIAKRALKVLKPGCILLLHDGAGATDADRSQTVVALTTILEAGKQRGYQFVTLPELFDIPHA